MCGAVTYVPVTSCLAFSQLALAHNILPAATATTYPNHPKTTIMKVLALLCSLFAIVSASSKPAFVAKSRALDIRGGAAIGPLDDELAVQLVKTGAIAYVAGAGSKFIAEKTGASGSQVSRSLVADPLLFLHFFR